MKKYFWLILAAVLTTALVGCGGGGGSHGSETAATLTEIELANIEMQVAGTAPDEPGVLFNDLNFLGASEIISISSMNRKASLLKQRMFSRGLKTKHLRTSLFRGAASGTAYTWELVDGWYQTSLDYTTEYGDNNNLTIRIRYFTASHRLEMELNDTGTLDGDPIDTHATASLIVDAAFQVLSGSISFSDPIAMPDEIYREELISIQYTTLTCPYPLINPALTGTLNGYLSTNNGSSYTQTEHVVLEIDNDPTTAPEWLIQAGNAWVIYDGTRYDLETDVRIALYEI